MESLKWLYDRVAGAYDPIPATRGATDNETDDAHGEQDHYIPVEDDMLAEPDECALSPLAPSPTEVDEANSTRSHHANEPKTPRNGAASLQEKFTSADSGYQSILSLDAYYQREREILNATPSKESKPFGRRADKTAHSEKGTVKKNPQDHGQQDYGFYTSLEDSDEQGRPRHDSMLSTLAEAKDETKATKERQEDESEDTKSLDSPSEAESSHASSVRSSPSGLLPRLLGFDDDQTQFIDNYETTGRLLFNSSFGFTQCKTSSPSFRPENAITRLYDVWSGSKAPSRDAINAHFEQPFDLKPPCWRITDGIDDPTILQQVSCLQCVLKNLPCDKKLPHCSRCVRSGHGPCLIQRQLLAHERWQIGLRTLGQLRTGLDADEYTVLVHLKGDSQELWKLKKSFEAKLLEYLQERCDRDNWAAPYHIERRGVRWRDYHETAKWKRFQVDFVRGRSRDQDEAKTPFFGLR